MAVAKKEAPTLYLAPSLPFAAPSHTAASPSTHLGRLHRQTSGTSSPIISKAPSRRAIVTMILSGPHATHERPERPRTSHHNMVTSRENEFQGAPVPASIHIKRPSHPLPTSNEIQQIQTTIHRRHVRPAASSVQSLHLPILHDHHQTARISAIVWSTLLPLLPPSAMRTHLFNPSRSQQIERASLLRAFGFGKAG